MINESSRTSTSTSWRSFKFKLTPVPDLIAFSIFSFGMLMVLAFSIRPSKRLLNLTSGPDSKKEKSTSSWVENIFKVIQIQSKLL